MFINSPEVNVKVKVMLETSFGALRSVKLKLTFLLLDTVTIPYPISVWRTGAAVV